MMWTWRRNFLTWAEEMGLRDQLVKEVCGECETYASARVRTTAWVKSLENNILYVF